MCVCRDNKGAQTFDVKHTFAPRVSSPVGLGEKQLVFKKHTELENDLCSKPGPLRHPFMTVFFAQLLSTHMKTVFRRPVTRLLEKNSDSRDVEVILDRLDQQAKAAYLARNSCIAHGASKPSLKQADRIVIHIADLLRYPLDAPLTLFHLGLLQFAVS